MLPGLENAVIATTDQDLASSRCATLQVARRNRKEFELTIAAGSRTSAPRVTWATHGQPFVAAVENGPLWATQFHPEKSGDAGAVVLRNWVSTL